MRERLWWAAAAALMLLVPAPTRAQAPSATGAVVVEADPVRCWWRTDRASIRRGEPYSAVLT